MVGGSMGHELAYTAPAGAEEFWERDGGFVYSFVRKQLGPAVMSMDAQDAAADIFERLLVARNAQGQTILEQYSAGYISARTGQSVTWRAFLAGKLSLYIRGKRESIARRDGREILLCDSVSGDGGEKWVELFGGQVWDSYPSLTDEEFTQRMRDYLAVMPDSWEGPGSLYAVFSEVLERVQSGAKATQVSGLSRKETAQALARIRGMLDDALAWQSAVIDVCGVLLSPSEAREALDRLRQATGNHVHRALAGHRLMTEGGTGKNAWYHTFSRAELAMFPGAAVESWEGKIGGAGNGHVKAAVIHGLTRLLLAAGVPEQASPPESPQLPVTAALAPGPVEEAEQVVSRAELLEAELWHITGLDYGKIKAIIAATEKVYA
jgi:hypothetical protein